MVLSAVFIGYKIFEIRNKKDFRKFVDIFFTRILGVLIPLLFFSIYLTQNNIWTEFIDYTILGIRTFSNTISYSKFLETDYALGYAVPVFLGITIIISIVTYFKKNIKEKEWAKKLRILMFYDIATAIVIYPISDRMHFAVASICTLLTVIYLVNIWLVNGLKIKNKKVIYGFETFFNAVAILIFLIYIIISIRTLVIHSKQLENQNYLEHFKYIETPQSLYEAINSIDKYIMEKQKAGKDVIILDSMAAAINIPINKYYKNYDMFNLGNFGANGEKRNN